MHQFRLYLNHCYPGFLSHGVTADNTEIATVWLTGDSNVTDLPSSISFNHTHLLNTDTISRCSDITKTLYVIDIMSKTRCRFVMHYDWAAAEETNIAGIMQKSKYLTFAIDVYSYEYFWFAWPIEDGSPHFYLYGNDKPDPTTRTELINNYFNSVTLKDGFLLRRSFDETYSPCDFVFYPYREYPDIKLKVGGLYQSCTVGDSKFCKVPNSYCDSVREQCLCKDGYKGYHHLEYAYACISEDWLTNVAKMGDIQMK